jgi:hypothetical protein
MNLIPSCPSCHHQHSLDLTWILPQEWEIMRIFVQLVLALTHIHARKALRINGIPDESFFQNSWGKEQYPPKKQDLKMRKQAKHIDVHHPR